MSETSIFKNSPRLSFLQTEHIRPGVDVSEIDFASSISPPPPFQASRFTVAPNSSTPVEENHDPNEIWVVIEGKGKLIYDKQEMQISEDNFVYFKPNKAHHLINDGDKTMVIFSIWWSDQQK